MTDIRTDENLLVYVCYDAAMDATLAYLRATAFETIERDQDTFVRFDVPAVQATSPFTVNEYDFDEGFYKGKFSYESPLDGVMKYDTPEAYGRERIAAFLAGRVALAGHMVTIMDLGSGTADLARTLLGTIRPKIELVNSDISGPWTTLGDQSLLLKGAAKLRAQRQEPYAALVHAQFDFNASPWPYPHEAFDYIASNMALHHVASEKKAAIARQLFDSLQAGGTLAVNDVFAYVPERVTFTTAGEKGPSECKGSVEPLGAMIARLRAVGFTIAPTLDTLQERGEMAYTDADLSAALTNPSEPFPVSKAVWMFTVTKPA